MSQASPDELVALLEDTRVASLVLLKDIDPNLVVYAESGWRARDIVGHMTDWDIEAVRAFEACAKGEVYQIPNFTGFDAYNHLKAEARWNQAPEAIVAEWEAVHVVLKGMVRVIPPSKLGEIIPYPWHASGSARLMVRIMAAHEHEHIQDIVRAARQAT